MRAVFESLKNIHLLFLGVYEKLVYFRNTPVLFWNFLIVVTATVGSFIYYTFPATSYELSVYFLTFDVFSAFFFYFLAVLFATILTLFLGSRGVYIICGSAIFSCWWLFFENLRPFFSLGGTKFFKFTTHPSLLNLIDFEFSLVLDKVSFAFVFLTITIGLCASVYSLTYFKNEPHADRFILLLHWFILSMSLLVMADNSILMFLGWELIGLTSFMLINFWTLRRGTIKAAFKAFTFNKISDIFILFFIVLMVRATGTANISVWVELAASDSIWQPDLQAAVLFLILGSSIKSAQLFGHLWLPDSMEAPIPASALIHSATLVSAGVYLLLRLQSLIFLTNLHYFVFILGGVTAFYGAVVSSSQTDAKKLLAYSTISHCGFLFVTISLGSVELTLIYLYLHGFFKALTFFCVGNLIKLSRGYQDTRTMGQFAQLLPIESTIFLICAVNLGGLPFTVGFFYKHLLQLVLISSLFYKLGFVFLFCGMLAGLVYVFRLVYFVLFDFKKGSKINYHLVTSKFNQYREFTNTAIFSVLGVSFFLLISYFVYFFYFYWLPSSGVYQTDTSIDAIPAWLVQTFFSISCFILFCSCFLPIIFVLLIVECRYEFSSIYRRALILIILFIMPFFFITGVGSNLYRSFLSNKF